MILTLVRRCAVGALVMCMAGGFSAIGFIIGASVVTIWYAADGGSRPDRPRRSGGTQAVPPFPPVPRGLSAPEVNR
jgi:hypothetical protein